MPDRTETAQRKTRHAVFLYATNSYNVFTRREARIGLVYNINQSTTRDKKLYAYVLIPFSTPL